MVHSGALTTTCPFREKPFTARTLRLRVREVLDAQ